jgi:hypothetical protein
MCDSCFEKNKKAADQKTHPVFGSANILFIPTLFFTYKVLNVPQFKNRIFKTNTFLEPRGNGNVRIHILYYLQKGQTDKFFYLKANFIDEKVDESKVPDLLSLIASGQYIASIPNMKNYLAKIFQTIRTHVANNLKEKSTNNDYPIQATPSPETTTAVDCNVSCSRHLHSCPTGCSCVDNADCG